jgi:hypothetical protein
MLRRFAVDEGAAGLLERVEDYWLTFGAGGVLSEEARE